MSKTIPTPQFTHNCAACTFIGHRDDYDVYVCPQGGVRPTVVVRYGNESGEYTSGAEFVTSGEFFRATPTTAEELRNAVFALVPESRVYRSNAHNDAVKALNRLQEPCWVNTAAAVLAEYAIQQIVKRN